jgi:putative ABC transport system permease protein
MMLTEHIRMALASIRSSRLRSFLTILGIVIGVVSVITIVSLAEGVKRQVLNQINHLGSDLITVRPGRLVERNNAGEITGVNVFAGFATSTLTEQDAATISAHPDIEKATYMSILGGTAGIGDKDFPKGVILGVSDDFPSIVNQKVEFGTFFKDDQSDKKVVVIGPGVAEQLFEEAIPIGKTMQIRGQDFIVRGVFEQFESSPLSSGFDFNNTMFIPYGVGKEITNNTAQVHQVLAKPQDARKAEETVRKLTEALKENHGGQEDFTILKQDEALLVADKVLSMLTSLITGVAIISLFVGGVGVMNVMIASVSERTREIGIRKTVGATNRQIRTQFLIEAITLSVWGAAIGVIISLAVNILLRIFTNLQPVVTLPIVLISVLAALIVGIVFGVAPAVRAAKKDPIDALRSI